MTSSLPMTALVAHTTTALQTLFTQFINTAKCFCLRVSLKKTETMSQSYPLSPASSVTVMAGESQLTPVSRFCYLSSYLSNTIDINPHLAKAGDVFGKLQRRLWGEHSIALLTKIAVYEAVVLSTLLYGCEYWVLYWRLVFRLDEFHMRCMCKIAGIKWQDRVPNTVLRLCDISGIEAFLLAAQVRWVGHVVCMEDDRIPKQVFF